MGELTRQIQALPEQRRRSVTWDQANEFALHANFTIDTGIQVYFCHLKNPWQRAPTRTPSVKFAEAVATTDEPPGVLY